MDKLVVTVRGGSLVATPSQDPMYPGIDVEFVALNRKDYQASNPRVLIEQPHDEDETSEHKSALIRALIWNNPKSEDYTEEISLWDLDGKSLEIQNGFCTKDIVAMIDSNHNCYEYHIPQNTVKAVRRYLNDTGDIITDNLAITLRKFALKQIQEHPQKWNPPVPYQHRCADCTSLVEQQDTWYCDELQMPCVQVHQCPEGLTLDETQ